MQQPVGIANGNADLEGVLSACLSPDNNLRQQAEAALRVCLFGSLHIALSSCSTARMRNWQSCMGHGSLHGTVGRSSAAVVHGPSNPPDRAKLCQQGACKQPEVLHALLGRLRTSDSAEVRLLAAQSIRRHAPKHWRRLSAQVATLRVTADGQ